MRVGGVPPVRRGMDRLRAVRSARQSLLLAAAIALGVAVTAAPVVASSHPPLTTSLAGPGDTVWTRVPTELKDLPLVLVPSNAPGPGNTFAILISGDGGWAALPRGVSGVLAGGGIPVVGLNALRYFWSRRTPEGAAQDLERILRYYLAAGGRGEVLLVGYSRGADVLPFMASRLSPDLLRHVRLLALLGPSETVQFQFHLADWWSDKKRSSDLEVFPEARRLVGMVPMLCAYGEDEKDSMCPRLAGPRLQAVALKGSHHFDGAYAELGELVLKAISASPPSPTSSEAPAAERALARNRTAVPPLEPR